MDRVKDLLKDHWHFFKPTKPQLAILIIGGGTSFHMEGKYRELFKSGLNIAARSTKAMIVTTGQNMGAVKLVGDAVSEAQYLVPIIFRIIHFLLQFWDPLGTPYEHNEFFTYEVLGIKIG